MSAHPPVRPAVTIVTKACVCNYSLREPFFCCRFRSRTPGPPPFSSMNSTPADSNARRIAKSLALVSAVSFSFSSARRMVVTLSADAAARSSAVQRMRDRVALIRALVKKKSGNEVFGFPAYMM
jgi:hypothetical protein